jgi:hypothetical protein
MSTSTLCIHLKPKNECENQVCRINEVSNEIGEACVLGDVLRQEGLKSPDIWPAIQAHIEKTYSICLGLVKAVVYDTRTDRYVVKFGQHSAKATNSAAEFLLRELNKAQRSQQPTVYARMRDGSISNVYLLFA